MNDRRPQNTSITKKDYSVCSYKYRIRKLLLIFYLCYYIEIIRSEICDDQLFWAIPLPLGKKYRKKQGKSFKCLYTYVLHAGQLKYD